MSVSEATLPKAAGSAAATVATAPPVECPTRCTLDPQLVQESAEAAASVATDPSPTSFDEPPCPGRSSAYVALSAEIGSCTNNHEFLSPP